MGIIQIYPDELDYVNAQLRLAAESLNFLQYFCTACLWADHHNYEILRPALLIFMVKYPALPALLEAERRDRGAAG